MNMDFSFRFLIVLLVLAALLSAQCTNSCSKAVQFEIPISIYPVKQTYQVNDTLWLEMHVEPNLEDKISMDVVNVGYHNFQTSMYILELLDSNWIVGIQNVDIVPSIGNVEIHGVTYPFVFPELTKFENENTQRWKFGLIFVRAQKNLVLLFDKDNPLGWSGEFKFPESNCIYGIGSSYFITNGGNIDYEFYVNKHQIIGILNFPEGIARKSSTLEQQMLNILPAGATRTQVNSLFNEYGF